jgi:lambda family phage tail tape measure protein
VTRVQSEQARVNKDAQFGVASTTEQYRLRLAELELVAKERNWTERQYADAIAITTREHEAAARAADIRRSALPGLRAFQHEASDLRANLDQTAVSGLNSMTSVLTQMTMGTKSAGEGFRELGQTVLQSITEMTIKMLVMAPIARMLQSLIGGFPGMTPTGAEFAYPGAFAGPRARGGPVPAGMWAITGEKGPEVVHGPGHVTPMGRGGGVVVNVTNNDAGNTRVQAGEGRRGAGGEMTIDLVVEAVESRMTRNVANNRGMAQARPRMRG